MPDRLSPTWVALEALTSDLMSARGKLAELQIVERRQRIDAQQSSGEDSVAGSNRYADAVTVDLAADIIDEKAKIAAMEDMRDLLHLAVTHSVELIGASDGQ